MVRPIGLAAAVVLGATGVVMLFGAPNAVADSSSSRRSSMPGNSTPDTSSRGDRSQYTDRGRSDSGYSKHGYQGSFKPPSRGESTSDASPPGEQSTSSNGAAIGGPTVGGRPATTGAEGTEAVSASPVPTPPNGAEPSAAGSPAAAVLLVQAPLNLTPIVDLTPAAAVLLVQAPLNLTPVVNLTPVAAVPLVQAPPSLIPVAVAPVAASPVTVASDEESAATPSVPTEESGAIVVPDIGGDALDATGPLPVAAGLSPDAHQSGVFVALLALAVLLFLAAHQFAGRRHHGLAGARDAESVARFE